MYLYRNIDLNISTYIYSLPLPATRAWDMRHPNGSWSRDIDFLTLFYTKTKQGSLEKYVIARAQTEKVKDEEHLVVLQE